MSALSRFLFGRKEKMEQVPTMTPEQQQLLSQILGGVGAPLGAGMERLSEILGGAPEAFEAFQAPAMRQFREEIVPGIAERFTGMDGGAQRSSAFAQTLGRAGESLAERLSAQRAGLQQQALSQLLGLTGMGMGARPYETAMRPGTTGFLGGLTPGIGMGLGQLLGGLGRY